MYDFKKPPVRHLSLDLWLTLIRSNKKFKPARTKLFKEAFNLPQPLEEILYVFAQQDRLFNSINEKTGRNLSREEMLLLILARLGKKVEELSIEEVEAFFEKADSLFRKYPPELLQPDIATILQAVKEKGISLSILSNTAFILGRSLREMLREMGLAEVFDFQIYSDECGHSKPSAQIFNLLYEKASRQRMIDRSEIIHIGDNPVADHKGALNAGMQAALFQPETNPLSRLIASELCILLLHSTT